MKYYIYTSNKLKSMVILTFRQIVAVPERKVANLAKLYSEK